MKYEIADFSFEIISEYEVMMELVSQEEGIAKIRIDMDFHGEIRPEPVKIRWYSSGCGVYTRWSPMEVQDHILYPNWRKAVNESRSACGMPLQCYVGKDGRSRVAVAVSDVRTPINIRSGIVEDSGQVQWELVLFAQKVGKLSCYQAELRIDTRKLPYEQTIGEVNAWWESLGYHPGKTAEAAFDPLYSTWYSYHQNVTPQLLLPELQAAAKLGMKTVIVDDGWQTDDNGRGYAYCGVWEPAETKIPDMKGFVQEVHKLGMKVMFWFSVPFVGKYSPVWKRFEDKFLSETTMGCAVLDPRYPEVREYLISAYEHAVRDWNVDGLKLDFINNFSLTEQSMDAHPDMDTLSLEDAVCTLLEKTQERLTQLKPDILIEFRQGYVGPVMLKYGNMLRAADCPMDAVTNRVRTLNLRLTSGEVAVHSDMLMWVYDDEPEAAADQFINILFSVPQISVRIQELPPEQYRMLKFYMDFWMENREVLMKGRLSAKHPEANYTLVSAEKDDQIVAAAYEEQLLTIDRTLEKISFVNGTGTEGLYVESLSVPALYTYCVYNCMGEQVDSGTVQLGEETRKFRVPASGMVILKHNG